MRISATIEHTKKLANGPAIALALIRKAAESNFEQQLELDRKTKNPLVKLPTLLKALPQLEGDESRYLRKNKKRARISKSNFICALRNDDYVGHLNKADLHAYRVDAQSCGYK